MELRAGGATKKNIKIRTGMVRTKATVNITQNVLAASREVFLRGFLPGVLQERVTDPLFSTGEDCSPSRLSITFESSFALPDVKI